MDTGLNKFRKFAIIFVICELMLVIISNIYAAKFVRNPSERKYMVDISRIITRMEAGEQIRDIDLNEYETIVSVTLFDAAEHGKYAYTVEEAAGELYRFEYKQEDDRQIIIVMNCVLGLMIFSTIIVMAYLDRKLITPFLKINNLPIELAKGNLSVPIKEEKSRYLGKFLWGMDMLREKLEDDKRRELKLLKEKKTLILSLSHDVKTPLSAIDLYAKALRTGLYDSDERRKEAFLGIEKNVSEIKRYVGEIVDASREDILSLDVKNGEVYLLDCINTITDYYSEKMEHLHTEFVVEGVDNCLIFGDGDRIVEVLQNVIENALKYGDGKRVDITFEEEENCKLVTISNTGCGIDRDELPHLFDSFYRGSNSGNVSGSGLGLYICKELMHRMEGEIFAKETEDSFKVTLVLKKM